MAAINVDPKEYQKLALGRFTVLCSAVDEGADVASTRPPNSLRAGSSRRGHPFVCLRVPTGAARLYGRVFHGLASRDYLRLEPNGIVAGAIDGDPDRPMRP